MDRVCRYYPRLPKMITRCAPRCPPRRPFVASDAGSGGHPCTDSTRQACTTTYLSGKSVQINQATSEKGAMKNDQESGMGSPELLLQNLNAALRELRGSAQLLGDPEIDDLMLPLMRRLLLAEVLSKEWIVAIGGSQGAGKTTLVRTIYGFTGEDAQWLQPNEGRGERLPVLVLEDADCTRVQGAVRLIAERTKGSFRMMERELTPEEFQRAVSDPDPAYLLPVLKVPSRFFSNPHQAWLLLPGYEKEDRKNREWQRLMRQALVSAAGCVIVTDETRMANQQQVEIVKDMLANELRGAQTLVAISKTEAARGDGDRQKALRCSAQRVYGIAAARADRWVVCTGSDDPAYVAEWRPVFARAVEELSRSGGGDRKAQLAQLEAFLSKDLTALIFRIRTKSRLFFASRDGGSAGGGEEVKSLLSVFDEECTDLRSEYQMLISAMLDKQYDAGWTYMQARLLEDHEGLKNHILDIFRKATESRKLLEKNISAAWRSSGSVLEGHAEAVGIMIRRKLGGPDMSTSKAAPTHGDSPLERLSYVRGKELQVWSRPNDEDQQNLRLLFAGRGLATQDGQRTSVGLKNAIGLLPTLALEYARLASLVPAAVGVNAETLNATDMQQRPDLVKQAIHQLGDGVNLGRTVLRGLAAVLAIDVAADGELDVPGVLTKTAAAGATAGNTAAAAVGGVGAAVVGLVAVGYLVHSAIQQARQIDEEARLVAQQMLLSVRDQHQAHFMGHFDELMRQLRARLRNALSERYRLDESAMEMDRLTKALADVRALGRDLLDELGRSGRTLLLFNVTDEMS